VHPRWGEAQEATLDWRNPHGSPIDPLDPAHWATFEDAVAVMRADPAERFGLGFVLTEDVGIVAFDRDDKGDAEKVARGDTLLDRLNEQAPTYLQESISGKGRHGFWYGSLPHGRASIYAPQDGMEVYSAKRFMAMTGRRLPQGADRIGDGTAVIADLFKDVPPPRIGASNLGNTDENGRSLGCSDDHILYLLNLHCRPSYDLLMSPADLADRSAGLMRIVGDLDKFTGDAAQLSRIVFESPCGRNPYNAEKIDKVSNKAKGLHGIDYWLHDARVSNDGRWPPPAYPQSMVEHGKGLSAVISAGFAEERARLLAAQAPDAAPTSADAGPNEQGAPDTPADTVTPPAPSFSPKVQSIIDQIKGVAPEIFVNGELRLTMPPGISARFCVELGEMVTDPQPAYIYSGYLFNLSGLLSRKFKLGTALGSTTLQFVVTGKFYTGKSRAAQACYSAFECAASYTEADPADPRRLVQQHVTHKLRGNVHKGTHASVNMLHKDVLERNGNLALLTDEAGNQVDRMLSGQDHLATGLRDYFKLSYDAGEWDGELSPPGSLTGHRSGDQFKCFNVNIPVFMTCTDSALKGMRISDLMDGYWTRPITHFYAAPLEEDSLNDEEDLRRAFSPNLARIVRDGLMHSNALDLEYAPVNEEVLIKDPKASGPDAQMMTEMVKRPLNKAELRAIAERHLVGVGETAEAANLRKRVQKACRSIVHSIQRENPNGTDWREIIVRMPDNARRVAVLLASIDHLATHPTTMPHGALSPHMDGVPRVEVAHLAWGFRYVLYWLATLLTGIDRGNVAIGLGSTELIVLDHIDRARRQGKLPISERDLRHACKYRLKQAMDRDAAKGSFEMLFESTLRGLERDGMIKRPDHSPKGVGGYATPHVFIQVDHPYWAGE
jgi:hypothetical protein